MNVELDPESAVRARTHIESQGMVVVGWYHSHPHFLCNPSVRDVENQAGYENHFEGVGVKPFVGAIVSPFYEENTSLSSAISWFHTQIDPGSGGAVPFRLVASVPELDSLSEVLARARSACPRTPRRSRVWWAPACRSSLTRRALWCTRTSPFPRAWTWRASSAIATAASPRA